MLLEARNTGTAMSVVAVDLNKALASSSGQAVDDGCESEVLSPEATAEKAVVMVVSSSLRV
jgi:hypothetical protein